MPVRKAGAAVREAVGALWLPMPPCRKAALCAALLCAGGVWLLSVLYYRGILETNFPAGWLWLFSFPLLSAAFWERRRPRAAPLAGGPCAVPGANAWAADAKVWKTLVLAVSAVYFVSHLYNFPNAPWNHYGLFDDAAWDVFVAQERCFTGGAFEIIFWNPDIGMISRELLFHYYISILFRLFGYNLLVFNLALVLLGWITVLFTALLAADLLESPLCGFAAGLALNFLPLEFTQVFMGHRYAICGPMILISAFFLNRAFRRRSLPRAGAAPDTLPPREAAAGSVPYAVAGGVFAGFAMESAIMGKQYLWALIGAAILHGAVYAFQRWKKIPRREAWTPRQTLPVLFGVLIGYAVAAAPLYAYIATHGALYNIRQANLSAEFFAQLRAEGFPALWKRLARLWETLFAAQSYSRQFSDAFPVLTWYLAVPAVFGAAVMFFRKYFVTALMLAITLAANVVSESYDFRLLTAAPFAAIALVYALRLAAAFIAVRLPKKAPENTRDSENAEWNVKTIRRTAPAQNAAVLLAALVLMSAPASYLRALAENPNAQRLLNHRDIAASRYIQDVVMGSEAPDFRMKWDEFRRGGADTGYDVLAATCTSYAHVHAYLQPYDSRQILRLFNDFPYIRQDPGEMRRQMARTLAEYENAGRDLVLVLESGDKVAGILADLDRAAPEAGRRDSAVIDGNLITMVRYRVPAEDLPRFAAEMRTALEG